MIRKPREHGPLRVVLVRGRRAEQRQEAVARVFEDLTAEGLDRRCHARDSAADQLPEVLRVQPLAQRRRAHDVTEERRNDATGLPRGAGDRRAAG